MDCKDQKQNNCGLRKKAYFSHVLNEFRKSWFRTDVNDWSSFFLKALSSSPCGFLLMVQNGCLSSCITTTFQSASRRKAQRKAHFSLLGFFQAGACDVCFLYLPGQNYSHDYLQQQGAMKNKAFTLGEHESTSKSGEEMGEWLFGREKTLVALATELIIILLSRN